MKNIFLTKIYKSFFLFFSPKEEVSTRRLLLAVSGGADSVSMLIAVSKLKNRLHCIPYVVTVNHNIRSSAESLNDVRFVETLCEQLGIECFTEEIPPSVIEEYAVSENCGIEAAARHFRYECFEKVAKKIDADFIATAHNQNDLYETILMRMFQGGVGKSLSGIQRRRGKYIRPLLDITRDEILEFLKSENMDFCCDATNNSDKYLRNRIRSTLVPALEKTFPNWKKGLAKTVDNIGLDCKFVEKHFHELNSFFEHTCGYDSFVFDLSVFTGLDDALKLRFILKAFNRLGIKKRISHKFLKKAVQIEKYKKIESGLLGLSINDEKLKIYTISSDVDVIHGYSLWIDGVGKFKYPLGEIIVLFAENSDQLVYIADKNDTTGGIGPFSLPFCIRSKRDGDKIETRPNHFKSVKKILNDAKLNSRNRDLLPIIEEHGSISAIYGFPLAIKNRFKFSLK